MAAAFCDNISLYNLLKAAWMYLTRSQCLKNIYYFIQTEHIRLKFWCDSIYYGLLISAEVIYFI